MLVLMQQVVGKKLNVPGRILQFVPLPLLPRPEVPVAFGPSAYLLDSFQVTSEIGDRWYRLPPKPVGNGVHHESKAHDTDTVHQARTTRRKPPGRRKDLPDSRPVAAEQSKDRRLVG